ncbi:MAG TPA: hypothetical protein VJ973_02735 [Christiangramia sp.]|nr:hypothetical protein [Christiangramia sp.]
MRTKVLLALAITLTLNSFGQIPKLKEIKNLENGNLIIGLTGNDKLDEDFKDVVEAQWKLGKITEYLPMEEARDKAKEDDNTYALYIDSFSTKSFRHEGMNNVDYKTVSEGTCVALSDGSKKPIFRSFIPAYKGNIVSKESLVHGVNFIHQVSEKMISENLKSAMKTLSLYEDEGKNLAQKTLYIPQGMIHEKFDKSEISEFYGSEYKVVPRSEWSNVIVSHEKDAAYVMIVPVPVGGKYMYQHHIIDAETGMIYGLLQPKAAMSLGSVTGINLSKGNTGYINKQNVKAYDKVTEGKW